MEIGIFTVTITGVLLTALFIKYLTFRPERVFSDIGENVLLCKKPHWFNNNKSRIEALYEQLNKETEKFAQKKIESEFTSLVGKNAKQLEE